MEKTERDRAQEIVAHDTLGFNVVFRRDQLRLSQSALAKRAGVFHSVISDIESARSNVTLDVLVRIASALEIEVADLLMQHAQPGKSIDDIECKRQTATEPTLVSATCSGSSNVKQKFEKCANSRKIIANNGQDATVLKSLSDSTMTTVHEVTEQPSHEVRQPSSTITSLSRVRLLKGRDRVIERLRSNGF